LAVRRGQLAFCAAVRDPAPAPAEMPAGIMLSAKAPHALLMLGPVSGLYVDVVFTPSSTSVRSMMMWALSTAPPAPREPPGTGCCMAHASDVAELPPEGVSVPPTFCEPNQPCAPLSSTS